MYYMVKRGRRMMEVVRFYLRGTPRDLPAVCLSDRLECPPYWPIDLKGSEEMCYKLMLGVRRGTSLKSDLRA